MSLESFVHDLETVVDDLGLERFPLMGLSQGGPVAMTYAHRHPERVSRLVLVGTFIKGRRARSLTPEDHREFEVQRELVRLGWGRDDHTFRRFFSSLFMPDADPQLWNDFAELLRRTTSAENALRLFDACLDVDVVEVAAAALDLPTLVLHARGDTRIPFEQGLQLATRIRGSRLVPLDSGNHLLRADEPAWAELLREVDAFLAEDETAAPHAPTAPTAPPRPG